MPARVQARPAVQVREVLGAGVLAVVALLACGSLGPYMELPAVEQQVYDACSDEAVDWCLEEKFGAPKVSSKNTAAQHLEVMKERARITDAHVDECIGSLGDGIASTEYANQGSPEKREAWLLSVGCPQHKIDEAKKKKTAK